MRWIGKQPPLYVWPGDEWLHERNGIIYEASIDEFKWICQGQSDIEFPKKTKILKEKNGNNK